MSNKFLPALILAITICAIVSCKKGDDPTPPTPPVPVDSTAVLGIQKDVFGSTQHDFADILEANNKRIFFCLYRKSNSTYEFYAGDEKDSVYQLQKYNSDIYLMTTSSVSACLKPNGDIVALLSRANFSGADSLITLVNKPHTNNWQVVSRGLKNTFWNNYYVFGNAPIPIFATKSGRLVITRFAKAAVSDDDGLTWRETFNMPAGYVQNAGMKCSIIGNRSFIISASSLLYSDDEFETGNIVTITPMGTGGWMRNKIVQLSDNRLVLFDDGSNKFLQSVNNGQAWTAITLKDPADSLSAYSNSYMAYTGGTAIRVRAKYKPCGYYYTVDIDPGTTFKFYPNSRPTCPVNIPLYDYVLKSCQREDKRTYYVQSAPIGVVTSLVIRRDY